MEGKKRGRKKGSGKKHVSKRYSFEGFEGGKKRRAKSRKRSRFLHGAADGFNPGNLAIDAAGLIGGAVAASFLASIIPFAKTPKMKALIPLLVGIGVLSYPKISKNRIANRAGLGAIAIGAYTLTKQFLPALPLMGGADDAEGVLAAIEALPDEQKAILGLLPQQETAGEITDQSAGAIEEADTYGELADDGDTYGELEQDGEDGEDGLGEAAPLSPATMVI